jgi:hypothetical protein
MTGWCISADMVAMSKACWPNPTTDHMRRQRVASSLRTSRSLCVKTFLLDILDFHGERSLQSFVVEAGALVAESGGRFN